jgi:hypothetical protein
MKARTALLDLFKESQEWRSFFRACCEVSAFRLRSQACQFCDELGARGAHWETDEVEDALLGLAHDLLVNTPAAQWDTEWTHELCNGAIARLAKRYTELSAADKEVLGFSAQDVWVERMQAAELANDPAAFRAALEGWEWAGLEAMELVRVEGGAA